jgi:S-adenosylmethionine/arginine decarboxylase-like enzyme
LDGISFKGKITGNGPQNATLKVDESTFIYSVNKLELSLEDMTFSADVSVKIGNAKAVAYKASFNVLSGEGTIEVGENIYSIVLDDSEEDVYLIYKDENELSTKDGIEEFVDAVTPGAMALIAGLFDSTFTCSGVSVTVPIPETALSASFKLDGSLTLSTDLTAKQLAEILNFEDYEGIDDLLEDIPFTASVPSLKVEASIKDAGTGISVTGILEVSELLLDNDNESNKPSLAMESAKISVTAVCGKDIEGEVFVECRNLSVASGNNTVDVSAVLNAGAGLRVGKNSIGLVAEVGINGLSAAPTVKPTIAVLNGAYYNPDQLLEALSEVFSD